ncbi:FmdB family zinc ribbon protein [Pseudorhizobium marinum]|uniref:FmdB family zinc ribbon protein n=1 Tax=Pseudorhizobium marinum TaxID=1496690 RepID=UPI000497DF27|nr:zinc ribbon domain-containing protein [Pseudorhizobium marinum]
MPNYDYKCADCGPFTHRRSMTMSGEPCECPECGQSSPRAFLSMPFVASMEASTRIARATNEKSAHEPVTSKSLGHGAGCSCCNGKPTKAIYRADGAKTFPSSRPWMISH